MDFETESVAHQACRIVLRPIVLMLLRVGVTWREFCELAKGVYVETATEKFGIRGRPTNVSRVSILTGIARKEVRRQRDLMAEARSPVPHKTTDATRVLSGWFQDDEFRAADGTPRPLPELGDEGSFVALCRRYGGDIAPQTMLKELVTTNTVGRDDAGNLIPLRRYYQPAQHDDENLLWATRLISDLGSTMNNNVFTTEDSVPRFGGKAENTEIPSTMREPFRAFLEERGQAFLEEVDDWLTANARSDSQETTHSIRLGVGLFAIDDETHPQESQR